MSANGILAADASGTLRRVPSSATVSTSNSPCAGSCAVRCMTASSMLMKAITNGPPEWFKRLAN